MEANGSRISPSEVSVDLCLSLDVPPRCAPHLLPDATAVFTDHRLACFAAEGFLEFIHIHDQSVYAVLTR
jgi:hypothetical protein